MSTLLTPKGKRCVIERSPLPDQTPSGLLILGREFPALGTVIAMSESAYEALGEVVEIGDLVYFNRSAVELREVPREPDHFVLDIADLWLRIRDEG